MAPADGSHQHREGHTASASASHGGLAFPADPLPSLLRRMQTSSVPQGPWVWKEWEPLCGSRKFLLCPHDRSLVSLATRPRPFRAAPPATDPSFHHPLPNHPGPVILRRGHTHRPKSGPRTKEHQDGQRRSCFLLRLYLTIKHISPATEPPGWALSGVWSLLPPRSGLSGCVTPRFTLTQDGRGLEPGGSDVISWGSEISPEAWTILQSH